MSPVHRHKWKVLVPLLAAMCAVACGDHGDLPVRAPSIRVAADHPLGDRLWPVLLQHCRRNPSCDPMSVFGLGAGEASGVAVYSTWFAESADTLENGAAFGPRIRVSLGAYRGEGGAAGRPMSPAERETNLRAYRDAQSRLTIEYRMPEDEPRPFFVSVRTQQVVLGVPGLEPEMPRDELVTATRAHVETWRWPDGGVGAEVTLSAGDETILAGRTTGNPSRTVWRGEEPEDLGFEPWVFSVQQELGGSEDSVLLAALKREGFIKLEVRTPDGALVFSDSFAAGGHEEALTEALAALSDPRVSLPLTDRCAAYVEWDNDDWARAEVSPAEATCDPLTSVSRERILDQQPSESPE